MSRLRLTMAQALLKYLAQQYVVFDGVEYPFVQGVLGIFGHGNVTGIGEALEHGDSGLRYIQARNEQGMVHVATAFAKQKRRLQIMACTSSIGPGALNMVTGAATATTNRIPVLLLPGDVFACRQPDPVLQQLENPNDYTMSVNDCFKPVSRYWDRIERPEQLMTAVQNALRVLTDPVDTGAVTLCLPQDVQAEAYDYPTYFFERQHHYVDRRPLSSRAVHQAVEKLQQAKRPLIIAGGGVHYSFATAVLDNFSSRFSIPVAETQAGKGVLPSDHPYAVGGIGVTGTAVANHLAKRADCILVVGSRLSDFTTASKYAFINENVEILHLNVSAYDAYKMGASVLLADAKEGLLALYAGLERKQHRGLTEYQTEIQQLKLSWFQECQKLFRQESVRGIAQTTALGVLRECLDSEDIVVCAAGSLPGDLHRLWNPGDHNSYHMEYAFSCMGYEVAGGLGVKMAEPNREVYVLVGDGSFLMLHSELLTSLQEFCKINVILFNNTGYQCIHHLQRAHGSEGFGNQFVARDPRSQKLEGSVLNVNFAALATSLGAQGYQAKSVQEMREALKMAKGDRCSTLIELTIDPNSMSSGYETWWRVGVAEVSKSDKVQTAHRHMQQKIEEALLY